MQFTVPPTSLAASNSDVPLVPGTTDQRALVYFNSTTQSITFGLLACADPQCSFALPAIFATNVFPSTCTPAPTLLARGLCLFISPSASGPARAATTSGLSLGATVAISAGIVLLGATISSVVLCKRKEVMCFKKKIAPPNTNVGTINPVVAIAEYK